MTQHPSDPDVPDGVPEQNHRDDSQPETPGGSFDELALRRLMRDAVRGIEPEADALNRLRQAVPARRTRRRQAMVGAAAGVLLVGTAVPAVLHAANSGSTDTVGAANAGSSHSTGSSPGVIGGGSQDSGAGGPAGAATTGGADAGNMARPSAVPTASRSGNPGKTPPSGSNMTVSSPTCARGQLGRGTAQTVAPDQDGRVYGSFRVVNISNASCTVSGEGQISVAAQGSTDPTKIQVVDHTAGDPATGLPDPATAPASVTLPPGKAYQVDFAWIPAAGGGTTGCAATPTGPTTGGGTGGSTGSGAAGANATDAGTSANTPGTSNSGTSPDSSSGGGTPPPPPSGNGITLSHTPDAGPPTTASTTVSGACAGTVYRTSALPAS
ncbi:hypothetical protein [Streptantibioticus ferralitis]|uniref:DUF4232 domain-containing protein n=1 Tax=Streptantibioticus ferralitis TaxID=236510 RepID=A0ABT5Z0D5_9ACTN|nr:hypothetical protein [Streptantibioticus ferralitis]MDF2257270.1 hypothetical protein [Streptantibioticus ferralitis]